MAKAKTTTTKPPISQYMNLTNVVLVISFLTALVVPQIRWGSAAHVYDASIEQFGGGGRKGAGRAMGAMESAAIPMMASASSADMRSAAPPRTLSRSMHKRSSTGGTKQHHQHQHQHQHQPQHQPEQSSTTDPRMLVYRGNMNLQIDRSGLHTVSDAVKEFAVNIGGYVESANSAVGFKTRNGLMAGAHVHLHLRVPSSQFRATMNYCRQLAAAEQDVLSESESVADVTEQYVDQSSRAAALTGTHQALLKLLASSTTTKDILAVRRELRAVVQELESRKAQMKSLKSQADFSVVQLSLNQKPPEKDDDVDHWAQLNWYQSLENAIKILVQIGVWLMDKCILTFVFAVPVSLFCFVINKCCLSKAPSLDKDQV